MGSSCGSIKTHWPYSNRDRVVTNLIFHINAVPGSLCTMVLLTYSLEGNLRNLSTSGLLNVCVPIVQSCCLCKFLSNSGNWLSVRPIGHFFHYLPRCFILKNVERLKKDPIKYHVIHFCRISLSSMS